MLTEKNKANKSQAEEASLTILASFSSPFGQITIIARSRFAIIIRNNVMGKRIGNKKKNKNYN